RSGYRMCIFAHIKRAVAAMSNSVIADGLSNCKNVRLGERPRERRAPVSARPERHELFPIQEVRTALKIFVLESSEVDQHLFWRSAASQRRNARSRDSSYRTGHGFTPQMSAAYSLIVRSLENFPEPATFKIAFRAQPCGSAYKTPSCSCALTYD